jgi:hypothetical protein
MNESKLNERFSFLIFNRAERRIKIYDDDYHYLVNRFFIFCGCCSVALSELELFGALKYYLI